MNRQGRSPNSRRRGFDIRNRRNTCVVHQTVQATKTRLNGCHDVGPTSFIGNVLVQEHGIKTLR
jgi:hypothetical protein